MLKLILLVLLIVAFFCLFMYMVFHTDKEKDATK